MCEPIIIEPMDHGAFAPFGDVVATIGAPDKMINQGLCARFHDRATLDFDDGIAGISLFQSEIRSIPFDMELMERHPQGSQAFIPMCQNGFLVVVAADDNGPTGIRAFETSPGQAINIHKNIWHGVLTPLSGSGLFAVIDRIGDGQNLEEFYFDTPVHVTKDRS